jgi:hypothetical protein
VNVGQPSLNTLAVPDADQIGPWARAEEALRFALDQVRPMIDPASEAAAAEFLDHNELGLAMDTLVDAAIESPADTLPREAVENLST